MSIDYKEFKKKVTTEKKSKYNLGIPPQNNKDKYPGFVWALQERTGTENVFYIYGKDGETYFVIRRYEAFSEGNPTAKKTLVPYSYDLDSQRWVTTAWDKDRPLFRLSNSEKDLPVIIFEGEKTVLAAEKEFKNYSCTTWSGGSYAIDKTDFSALKDRKIILWADNDKPGAKAMHHVAKILIEKDITEDIQMVNLPKGFKDGWDVADQIEKEGITYEGLLELQTEYDPHDKTVIKIWKEIDERVQEKILKKKVLELITDHIYIRSITSFFEKNEYELISKEQLNDWNMEHTQDEEVLSRQMLKQSELVKVHSIITHAGMETGLHTVKPGQFEAINPGIYYNTYRPSGIISKPGNVDNILDYYSWYCGKNWHYIEKYIAFMVQNPGVKIKWSPCITSVEGGGKNLLSSMISKMLGDHNCNTQLNFEQVTSKFANVLLGLQFGVINELDLSSRKNIKANTNSLKKIIADPVLTIELKGKPQIKIPNFANFFIFSNDEDCLHLTKDARRYLIVNIKHTTEAIEQKLEQEGYKDIILDALDFGSEKICHLKNHFENVVNIEEDIKIFTSAAPKTEDFYEIVEKSKPGIHRALDSRLNTNLYPFENYTQEDGTVIWKKKVEDQYLQPQFSGMVIAEELYTLCLRDKDLSREHITRDNIIDWCKKNCISWKKKDGSTMDQKQIIIKPSNGTVHRPPAYLIKDLNIGDKKLSNLTEGELGDHHSQTHIHHELTEVKYDQYSNRLESKLAETPKSNF